MAVAGICHSDDHYATGDTVPDPAMVEALRAAGVPTPDWFPLLGGYEGAGVVEQVGPNVAMLNPLTEWACRSSPLAAAAGGA